MPNTKPARVVKTTETTFEIIELIKEADGANASTIADELGLAISTVHDHLVTLDQLGFITKGEQGYKIGLKFLDYGTFAKNRYDIIDISTPTLKRLADKTGEFVWFYIEEHGYVVAVAREKGENAVRSSRLGRQLPMHSTAGGKAILANLPEERVMEIIERNGLQADTKESITERMALLEELDMIREQGYATNDEESKLGLRAVGGAIKYQGEVLGAISVPGPKHRLNDDIFENTLPEYILEALNEIELNASAVYK